MDPRAEDLAPKRLRIFARVCLGWGVVLVLRLVDLQIVHHDKYVKSANSQQIRNVQVQAPRGSIFDRTGEPLAMSVQAESVVVNPIRIPDPAVAAELLSVHLGLEAKPLLAKIKKAISRKSGFMYVKRRVSEEEAERLRSYGLG